MQLFNIYESQGWNAVQAFYEKVPRTNGLVPLDYFRQYHALARKIQLENQGPITQDMIERIQNSRTCLCTRNSNGQLIVCDKCKNKQYGQK